MFILQIDLLNVQPNIIKGIYKTIQHVLSVVKLKLSNVIAKDDNTLKDANIEVVNQMKDTILQYIEKRVGILENSLFDSQKENETLKKHVKDLEKALEERANKQKVETDRNKIKQLEKLNDLEQYGCRNNIIINGIDEILGTNQREG